jgi:hypothetical protein
MAATPAGCPVKPQPGQGAWVVSCVTSLAIAIATSAMLSPVAASPPTSEVGSVPHAEQIAAALADLLRDAIPPVYERKKDWGRTKRIPVGLENTGQGLRVRLRKREREVKHGIWKHYRVTQIDPEKNLKLRITDLRSVGPARVALTVHVFCRIRGWGRARVYQRGLHVMTVTAEADAMMELVVDCEVGVRIGTASHLASIIVDPLVTHAQLTLHDLKLTRLGKLRGAFARELSGGLKHIIDEELKPAQLTSKLNRAIDKKRERLEFSLDEFADGT